MRLAGLAILAAWTAVAGALDTEAIVERNQSAVVILFGQRGDDKNAVQSSGCLVEASGLILTTAHQLRDVDAVRARYYDGSEHALTVVAIDKEREIALLKSDGPAKQVVRVGDASALKSGSNLVSIAAPVNLDFSTVTGIVSNTNRTYQGYPAIQTNLPASPGSSGGPVFDQEGMLVGLVIGKLQDQGWVTVMNPVNNAYPLLHKQGVPVPGDGSLLQTDNGEIVPQKGLTLPEQQAIDAYNAGVRASAPAEKIAAYTKAIRTLPKFYEAWFNLAVAQTAAGDVAQATEAYKKAREIRPEAIAVHRNLGRLALREKKPEEAVDSFNKAVALAPKDASVQNDLGEALRQTKQWAKAEEAFKKAIELKPDYASACYNLGLAYASEGKAADAVQQFARYLELSPNAADTAEVKAMIEKLKKAGGDAPAR